MKVPGRNPMEETQWPLPEICPICGGTDLLYREVMWPELTDAWELSREEIDYVNLQQGFYCPGCVNNLRTMALASAIMAAYGFEGSLAEFSCWTKAADLKILEINEAGTLSSMLKNIEGHHLVRYPEFDMMALSLSDADYDLVIHSDTLEHVPDPLAALAECRRVLRPRGHLIYTVPAIVGRLTRSRKGLPPSWHNPPGTEQADYKVATEFGADLWTYPLRAGFTSVKTHVLHFPAAFAIDTSI